MLKLALLVLVLLTMLLAVAPTDAGDFASLKKAITFYASYNDTLMPDVGSGPIKTRSGEPTSPTKFTYADGYDKSMFKIAKSKGIAGGCLEVTDVPPRNGRIFYQAKGNLAYKKGGWSGSMSMWINTDPNTLFKLKFCDPIQMTQKGATNGGIWFDFNDAKPRRDMRMGIFPAVPEGKKGAQESDADAPMVRVPGVPFKVGDWHHIAMTWTNLDTGKTDALATLYIDGKKIGDVKDKAIAMEWDIEKAGIYVAVGYCGLLDELALFNRTLTTSEVAALHKTPGLLAGLKRN
jgi:hypothetical protein